MLAKTDILNVLKKYGYNSLNRAPFLYQDKKKFGIYFVWPHKHYGSLERVLFFKTLDDVEEAVYKYWWLINNKNKYPISVQFDDYETKYPSITYTYQNQPLTIQEMKNFQSDSFYLENPKNVLKIKELLRTAHILILVLEAKIQEQNSTYAKGQELKDTYQTLKKDYNTKLNLYKNETEEDIEVLEDLESEEDKSHDVIENLKNELESLHTTLEIQDFINTILSYLFTIEMDTNAIQNAYLVKRYPYEIQDEALLRKKKLLKSKQDPFSEIASVDRLSPCKKIMAVTDYVLKEKERIQRKYSALENVRENVLGDYLVGYDKLNIELTPLIHSDEALEFTKEDLLATLKNNFKELLEKEQSACFIATSFLRDCLNLLFDYHADTVLNIQDVITKLTEDNKIHLFKEAYTILDDYRNVKIRVKYFSIIKMKTFSSFMLSLVDTIKILKTIKQPLSKSFYAYYFDDNKEIVSLYLKNIMTLQKENSYIAQFMPNALVFYSPLSIARQLDIVNDIELIERESDGIFMLKSLVDIKKTQDKKVVTYFEKEKTKKKGCLTVLSMKEKNKCTYYTSQIYNREDV